MRLLRDMTAVDVRAAGADGDTVMILPFGSVESHGPHLPVGTDTVILEALLARLRLPDTCVLAPTVECSVINYWRDDDGMTPAILDLDLTTWRDAIADQLRAFGRLGFRTFVAVTWHDTADFISALRQVAKGLRTNPSGASFEVLRAWQIARAFAKASGKITALERHAALIETSCMLAVAPGRVGAFAHVSGDWSEDDAFGVHGTRRNPDGVYGDPRSASAEFGETVLTHTAAEVERLFERFLPAAKHPRRTGIDLEH